MTNLRSILPGAFLLCSISIAEANSNDPEFEQLLQMDLEQLLQVNVVTASRYEQKIYNSSSVISVLTREDFLRFGGNTIQDVLQYFPGFVPVGDRVFGLHGSTFRGDTNASGEHILTLLDGQPYRSMQTAQDSTTALFRSFPLAAVERIELVHGPGSVIYGTNAMTGVINIITRQANNQNSDQYNSEINIQSGRWDTRKQTYRYGSMHDNWKTAVTIENHETDGWPITEDNNNTPPATPFSSIKTDRQVIHANIENNGFHLRSFLVNYESLYPEFGPDSAESNQRYWNIGYGSKTGNWDYAIDVATLKVENTLITEENDRNHTLEASANSRITPSLKWLLGFSAAQADNKAEGLNVDFEQSRYAVFSQVDYGFNDQWTGLIGAQWNKIQGGEEEVSPRAGFIFHQNEYQGIKLLYNEAFRSPTASETDVQFFVFTPAPLLLVSGNPDLKPEKVKTLDIQWFSYNKTEQLTIGGFYSRYYDRVYQLPLGALFPGSPLTYLNGETVDMWGLEVQGKWQVNRKSYLELAWTLQRNETESGNFDSTLAPRWTANIGYSYMFDNDVLLSVYNNHVSKFGDSGSPTPAPNPESESYDLMTINMNIPLAPEYWQRSGIQAEIVLLVQNALNEEVWLPETAVNTTNTFQTQYGRAYYGTLKMRW